MGSLAVERKNRFLLGRCKMKIRIILASFSLFILCVSNIAHAEQCCDHDSAGITLEAVDEMISRFQRLRARIVKSGKKAMSQEDMILWQFDEMCSNPEYKLLDVKKRREFEDKLEKAKNEAVRQLRKRQNKSAQTHETSSNNDAVKIKLVPKKKEIKNKRQKKKMPRKVIQANV